MKKISVCDSSLKVICTGTANVLSFKEKLEIAKRLNELWTLRSVWLETTLFPKTKKSNAQSQPLVSLACTCLRASAHSVRMEQSLLMEQNVKHALLVEPRSRRFVTSRHGTTFLMASLRSVRASVPQMVGEPLMPSSTRVLLLVSALQL